MNKFHAKTFVEKSISKKRKIIYFTDAVARGGAEEYLKMLALGVDKGKYEVRVALPEREATKSLVDEIKSDGIDVDFVETSNQAPYRSFYNSLCYFLKKGPQILHFILPWPTFSRYPLLAAILLKKNIILTEQLVPNDYKLRRYDGFYKKLIYKRINKAIAVSEENKNNLIDIFDLPESKINVIHNSIDIRHFQDIDSQKVKKIKEDLGIVSNQKVLTTIARLDHHKGHKYLIEAAKGIILEFPNVIFLVVGYGKLRKELEEMVADLDIKRNLIFTGVRADIPEILSLTDIFILPSLFEGLPFTILEAMAAGKPVVSTRVSGIPEQVVDGETGILVDSKDVESLSQAILFLLKNPEKVKMMGERGRERAEKYFSKDTMLDKTLKLYSSICF